MPAPAPREVIWRDRAVGKDALQQAEVGVANTVTHLIVALSNLLGLFFIVLTPRRSGVFSTLK